ncbi:MAG: sigma-70 family RNA polymerase sigma factor [Steroidobacteraceae bacterium]
MQLVRTHAGRFERGVDTGSTGGTPPDRVAAGFGRYSGESGDPRARALAVSELFRQHNRTLVRFLQSRLQNEQEAREIAQEAYVRLLELGRTGAVGFLRAYLFRIALNLAIDRIRSRKSRSRLDVAKLKPVEEMFEAPSVEHHALAADELRVFRTSLDELPAYCREALMMSRIEGLSTAEIGRRLGRSERMVRRYVVHALVYCRHRVDGLPPAEAGRRTELPEIDPA